MSNSNMDTGKFDDYSALEDVLSTLISQALGIDTVGIHDDFFELGGNSIKAAKVIAQLEGIFPSKEPLLMTFLQNPTIACLSSSIIENANGVDVNKIADVMKSVILLSDDDADTLLNDLKCEDK